jgi:hypothetical protein
VAVLLTLVKTKQIRMNIHKRNNTKHSKYRYTYYQNTHTYTHPHITKPTHIHTPTHTHTPTHPHTHTYTHPHIHTPTQICPQINRGFRKRPPKMFASPVLGRKGLRNVVLKGHPNY